ncbi:MAG: hypothetical protein LBS84_03765 [Clostridiales bacterium]|jgi:hypothetical protein|nr:hypothetical protein [Clostridiales bacterium]
MESLRDRIIAVLKILLTAAVKATITALLKTAFEKLADIRRRADRMK